MYVERDELLENGGDYRGLGLAPVLVPLATTAVTQAGGAVTDFFGGLFGGGTKDWEVAGWQEGALAGATPCQTGTLKTYSKPPPGRGWEGPWTEGMSVGPFDREELRRALEVAPRGSPGDDPGTVEGLITAVEYTATARGQTIRRPRDMRELANAAAFIALGRTDCVTGWDEAPTLIHAQNVLNRYKRGEYAAAPTFGGAGPAAEEWGGTGSLPLPELGELAKANPLVTMGVLGAIVLGAALLARR